MKNNENQKNVCCMLSKWAFLFLLCVMSTLGAFAQDRTVKGTVLDSMGETIIGANVMVKGTTNGTITDMDGNFSLSVPDNAKFLEVSFIGYETASVSIPQSNIIKITLKESSVVLDEVVAIGYGVQKKGSVTGAIAKVDAEKLGDRPISDVSSALQGQMAGVEIRTTSGEPGKDIQIRVRGAASINADSDPLYVVDGIPVDNLNSLNPSDIESIEVLKDASSSAIYGSRGANGVVLVTTKKGKEGKIKVEFSANVGFQQLERKMDLLSAEEWIEAKTYYNNTSYVQKYAAQGATINDDWDTRKAIIGGVNYSYMLDPRWTEANYGGLKLIDWQDEFYRTALMQDYQVSVSGGTQKTNYRFSVGYLDQEGIATGTDYSRLNLRTNIESQVSDRIKIGLNIAPSVSWSNGGRVDGKDSQSHIVLSATPVAEPEAGLYTGAEPYERYMWAGGAVSPIAYMEESTNATDVVRINASAYLQADLGQGFKAEITGAWNYLNKENRSFVPSSVTKTWNQGEGLSTTASRSNDRSNDIMLQALLHYNREFGKHTIGAMLGYSMEESKGSSSSLKAKQFPNNSLEVFDMSFATISGAKADLTTPVRLLSYFGRVQYDYADRYLLTASLRRDGSSKFGKNSRWGWFPAISAAWRISNEAFWSDNFIVNSLKLRGSWGMNGNNSIPSNAALSALSNANYAFNGSLHSGFSPSSVSNPDLGWEKTHSWNVAFDMGMFDNRIYLSADYYVKRTKDLLYKVAVPSLLGYSTAWGNIGSLENKGFEVELSTQNIVGRFNWSTSLNFGLNKNEIISLGADNATVYTGYSNTQVLQVGKSLKEFYMYKAIGVYQKQSEIDDPDIAKMKGQKVGDVRYEDVDKNGIIDERDRTYVGHPSPDFTFGMTNTFRYKNFDLSVLVTGQMGGKVYGLIGRAIDRPGMGVGSNALGHWRNMWRSEEEPGDGSTPSIFSSTTSSLYDTRWLYDSDFIKIKNITIGYQIPVRKYISYARVYASIENVYMWDKYDGGYSPESNNGGSGGDYDYGAYPQARTFSLGVNLTF